jgi:hypothetical protein
MNLNVSANNRMAGAASSKKLKESFGQYKDYRHYLYKNFTDYKYGYLAEFWKGGGKFWAIAYLSNTPASLGTEFASIKRAAGIQRYAEVNGQKSLFQL